MKCVTCGLGIREDRLVDGKQKYIHTETSPGVAKTEFYNCSYATGNTTLQGVATPVKLDDDDDPPPPPPPENNGEGESDSELEGPDGSEGEGEGEGEGQPQEQKQGQGKEDKIPQEKEKKQMGRPKKNPQQAPKQSPPKEYKYSEMEQGKFYLLKGSTDGTLYTRSLQGDTVWFHECQVGVFVKDKEPNKGTARFLLAPAGTPPIVLVQEACIFA